MRLIRTGFLATLALCAAGGQVAAQPDAKVLVLGSSLPETLAPIADNAVLVPADGVVDEVAKTRAELIYVGSPLAGDVDGTSALPMLLAELPADRATTVVVNSCGWEGQALDHAELTAALADRTEVTLAIPREANGCDAEGLASAFVTAAGLENAERRAALQDGGYLLEEAKPEAASPMGGLVISALPAEAMAVSDAPKVILASSDPTASRDTVVSAPDTNVSASPADPIATRRPGGPEPSIIVGDLAVLVAADARGPLGLPHQAREAIRQRDPAMFNRLLSRGAFDPEEAQMVAGIQTELARMNCYKGGIDGDWGSGSASALRRYFEALGSAQAAAEPEIGLYRTIIRNEAVQCPDVQPVARAAPTRSSGGGARGTRSTPTRTGSSGQATAPAASRSSGQSSGGSQDSSSSRRTISTNPSMLGTGAFR
ncbi:hypothetical protein [Paracoccus saliphilus]|uniref:Caspase domain-containing protein n=1 Tax=Paracoccus saliphilus TaxID=405559 RepID=A0AA46A486_9RHOB|nr:hypothetical protein [Paracoccus saliphilus]WCR03652.1 hypothetical protein JHX88_02425 [Paracoccus saliphilus]SIS57302.1 hypothetical protein SAMN05421772_101561 [Paracoccus saliphilus]